MTWWTIHEDALREALEKVAAGTHPEVVYVELLAGVEAKEDFRE